MKNPHRAIAPLICLWLLAMWVPSVQAEWRRQEVPIAPENVLRFTADPAVGLVILDLRKLTIADPKRGKTRRSFTLNSQTDALVDFFTENGNWWLASRRSIWRSRDKGYSWSKERSHPRNSDRTWLGFARLQGSLYALSEETAEALVRKPNGSVRFGRIQSVESGPGGTAILATRGLFVTTDPMQTYTTRGLNAIGAFYSNGVTHWVAAEKFLLTCEKRCERESGIPGIRSIVNHENRYWAASTDTVWQRTETGAWTPRQEGLGAASPGRLAVFDGGLFFIGERALFRWVEREEDIDAAFNRPNMRPTIGEVRRMVREAQPLLFDRGNDWNTRARWKAAAPTLDVAVKRGLDERVALTRGNTISVSTTENRILLGPDGRSTTRSDAGSWDYGLSLRWDLDDLVFNSQELSASNELEDIYRLRESVMLDVTRLYFDRVRALLSYREAPSALTRREALMRAAELTASLDYYTDGRFSQAIGSDGEGEP